MEDLDMHTDRKLSKHHTLRFSTLTHSQRQNNKKYLN